MNTDKHRWALSVLFLMTIALIPVWEWVHDFKSDPAPVVEEKPLEAKAASETVPIIRYLDTIFPAVAQIEAYEKSIEEQSPLRAQVLPPAQHVLTGLLGAGNEQVYPGRGDWLFYRSGVDYLTTSDFEWEAAFHTVLDFHNQLSKRGVALIVMPVPVKAQIHPEYLSPQYAGCSLPLQNPSYAKFLKKLREYDVQVFDPTPLIFQRKVVQNTSVYLKTDTHWTPETMDRIAFAVAENIKEQMSSDTKSKFTRSPVVVKNKGDITTMLQLPDTQSSYANEVVTIQQVRTRTGAFWKPDQNAPFLLLGDSFSNIYSLAGMGWGEGAGFAEQLSYYLQMPVDRISINAGGAHTTRKQLQQDMLRGHNRLEQKKVVIWQFAMRELREGNWTKLTLPEVESPVMAVEHNYSTRIVRATIKDHTAPPKPGSVPYADCIISLRLEDIEVVEGDALSDDVIAFVWGMQNNKWTAAAALRPGDEIVIALQNWAQVETQYGSYNRKELDDDDAFLLDVFWGTAPRGGRVQ